MIEYKYNVQVLMLLLRGADINAADNADYTPILVAIEGEFTDLVLLYVFSTNHMHIMVTCTNSGPAFGIAYVA
jgi:hypothetical protein